MTIVPLGKIYQKSNIDIDFSVLLLSIHIEGLECEGDGCDPMCQGTGSANKRCVFYGAPPLLCS